MTSTSTHLFGSEFELCGRDTVSVLKCSVCREFREGLISMKNFSPSVHRQNQQHPDVHVQRPRMHRHAQEGNGSLSEATVLDVTEYAPIAKALLLPDFDPHSLVTLKRKFEVAYFIAKENLAFMKMKPLCELEQRYGVDLGEKYKSNCKCAEFVEFIAGDIQQQLLSSLQKAKFNAMDQQMPET